MLGYPVTFENLKPRMDATAKLLLLLARSELIDDMKNKARTLAAQVEDWDELVEIATRKFAITYVYRHLSACAPDIVPCAALVGMRSLARATVLSTLRVLGAQVRFHRTCIQATGARHAYLKGAALARQYCADITERHCRDVDVLVASQDFHLVMNAALVSGYRIVLNHAPPEFAGNSQDVRFLARYADVVTLLGPDSVPVEVHRRLDKLSVNFDLDEAIATAEQVQLPGALVNVLSKPLHFVYLSYHHSRHFWSHLHWLADLDGMAKLPEAHREQVLKIADTVGIRPTIDAAFQFQKLVSAPTLWSDAIPEMTGGGQFLKACLVNLCGDLSLEEELRKGMTLNDFMSAWQLSPGRYNEFWFNSWVRRLRPTVTQYVEHRYPAHLQWLYSLQNAVSLAKNGLLLTFSRATRGTSVDIADASSNRAARQEKP